MDSDVTVPVTYGLAYYVNQQSGPDDQGQAGVEASTQPNICVPLQGKSRSSGSNSNVSSNAELGASIDPHRDEFSRFLESRGKFPALSDFADVEEVTILNNFTSENNDVNHISAEIENYINEVAENEDNDLSNRPVADSPTTSADEGEGYYRDRHHSDSDDLELDQHSLDDLDGPDLFGDRATARLPSIRIGMARPCRPKTRNSSTSRNATVGSADIGPYITNIVHELSESYPDFFPNLDFAAYGHGSSYRLHNREDAEDGDRTRPRTLPRSPFPDMEVRQSSSASSRVRKNQRRPKTLSVDGFTSKILQDIRVLYVDDVFDIDEHAKTRMEIRTRLRTDRNELLTNHFVNWIATKWREYYDKCIYLERCMDQFEVDLEATTDATLRRLLMNRINIDKAWQESLQENMDFDHLVADYRLCFESVDRDGKISLRGDAAQALQKELLLSGEAVPPPLPENSPPASPLRAGATSQKPATEQTKEHAEKVTKDEPKCIEIHHINPKMHVVDVKSQWKVPPASLAANREKRQYKAWGPRPREPIGGDRDRRTKWERVRDTVLVELMRCFLK